MRSLSNVGRGQNDDNGDDATTAADDDDYYDKTYYKVICSRIDNLWAFTTAFIFLVAESLFTTITCIN